MSETFLTITSNELGKVFQINRDGSVGYTVKGKYIIADNDKKLGVALGQALILLNKMNEETIRKQKEVKIS